MLFLAAVIFGLIAFASATIRMVGNAAADASGVIVALTGLVAAIAGLIGVIRASHKVTENTRRIEEVAQNGKSKE